MKATRFFKCEECGADCPCIIIAANTVVSNAKPKNCMYGNTDCEWSEMKGDN